MNDDVLKSLDAQIALLKQELAHLESVRAEYLKRFEPKPKLVRIKERTTNPPKIIEGSIKEGILKILLNGERPMKALAILRQLNSGPFNIKRTSLSPQLSRLRHEGRLNYQDKEWGLTDEGKEEARKIMLKPM